MRQPTHEQFYPFTFGSQSEPAAHHAGTYNPYGAALGGVLGGGIGQLMGQNPAAASDPYLSHLEQQLPGYYQPYMQHGQDMYGPLSGALRQNIQDPGSVLGAIGSHYSESPGFQFQKGQAEGALGHAAAAGGMAGTPMHQQQAAQLASNLASQDYQNYLRNALGIYGQGLSGAQNIYGIGAQSANELANQMSQLEATRAAEHYAGQQGQNQATGGWLGALGGALGSFIPGAGLAGKLGDKIWDWAGSSTPN